MEIEDDVECLINLSKGLSVAQERSAVSSQRAAVLSVHTVTGTIQLTS